jgi:hypothetical protein
MQITQQNKIKPFKKQSMKNLTLKDALIKVAIIGAIAIGIAYTGYLKATGKF